MAKPRIDSVEAQATLGTDGVWVLTVRTFDANRCKWDNVEEWRGQVMSPWQGLAEAEGLFDDLATALLKAGSQPVELPFP